MPYYVNIHPVILPSRDGYKVYSMTSYILSTIILFGTIQGIFLSIILFSIKKGNNTANRFFSGLIFTISLSMGSIFLEKTPLYRVLPTITQSYEPLQFLFGPLLYHYIKTLTTPHTQLGKTTVLHFTPAVGYLLFFIPVFLYPGFIPGDRIRLHTIVFEIITSLHMWLYIIYSLRLIRSYHKNIKNNYSQIDTINLSWLRKLLMGMVIIYIFFVVILVTALITGRDLNYFENLTGLVVTISIFVIAYFIILNSRLFETIDHARKQLEEPKVSGDKYKNSPLTSDDMHQYRQKLITLMEEHKRYLQPGLTLSALADELNIPRQYLSQVINETAGCNFYDFINTYRINEVKKMLREHKHKTQTLLSLALDAGFNSKATFNTAFKKNTGLTPTQFIKTHLTT